MRAIVAIIALAVGFSAFAAQPSTNEVQSEYTKWTQPFTKQAITSSWLGYVKLKLVVTTVKGEIEPSVLTNMSVVEKMNQRERREVSSCLVSTNGYSICSYSDSMGARECCLKKLSEDDFKRLDILLSKLPDDGSNLPPPGQRVVVQVLKDESWQIRIYDRAKAPQEVKAVLDFMENPFDKA